MAEAVERERQRALRDALDRYDPKILEQAGGKVVLTLDRGGARQRVAQLRLKRKVKKIVVAL